MSSGLLYGPRTPRTIEEIDPGTVRTLRIHYEGFDWERLSAAHVLVKQSDDPAADEANTLFAVLWAARLVKNWPATASCTAGELQRIITWARETGEFDADGRTAIANTAEALLGRWRWSGN